MCDIGTFLNPHPQAEASFVDAVASAIETEALIEKLIKTSVWL